MSAPGVLRLVLAFVVLLAGRAPAAAQGVPDWWTAPLGGVAAPVAVPAGADLSAPVAGAMVPGNRSASIDCLAKAIAYEAANEPLAGRQAVAQVVLNRARHKAYPKSICGVVFQGSERRTGCQFTFTCDGSLRRALSARSWTQAVEVARQAIDGRLPATVGAATHYHADYVAPRWAPSLVKVASIGAHVFYRFPGRAPVETAYYTGPSEADGAPATAQGFSAWGLNPAKLPRAGS